MPHLPCIELDRLECRQLLGIARRSIVDGQRGRQDAHPQESSLSPPLAIPRAVFVTLTLEGALRGCIGSMTPEYALARAVAESAFSAAFHDPRFPPLERREQATVTIEISVLSELQNLQPADRESLLAHLRPGLDGLLLEEGRHRATFLPKVWEQLPEPEQFLQQLLLKAGLAPDYWSDSLRFQHYSTLSFSEDDTA